MKYDFNVIVNADAPSVSKEGFGTIAVLGTQEDVDFQVLYDLADYKGDEEGNIYKRLQIIFSQKPAPRKVLVRGLEGATMKEVIESIQEETDDFFFITTAEIPEDLEEGIAFVETLEKVYLGAIDDLDVLGELIETGYENTTPIFDNLDAAAGLAAEMSFNPGGKTAHGKSLVGVKPSKFSNEVYSKVTKDYDSNVYIRQNQKNRVVNGKALNGQWLDVVIGKYWIKFTIEQRLDDLITSVDKIGYNNDDIGSTAAVVATVMNEALERNIIDDFKIDKKDVNEISASEKSTRVYNYLKITGHLQGAVHGGDLTVNLVYKEADTDE